MINALSIDLEDWHHPELVRRRLSGAQRPRVGESTEPILRLLDRYGVKATFFVLGEVAEREPEPIRRIRGEGHEIACHGMSHRPLWDLSAADFDGELKRFGRTIRGILGEDIPIRGYRAPTFSLDDRTKYALPCLAENGFLYDSSVFPVRNYAYGVKGAPLGIYRPDFNDLRAADDSSPLVEFPLAAYERCGVRIPVGGGFYLRLLPYPMTRRLLREINRSRPFVIYLHPWETHPGTPRLKTLGARDTFITYHGIGGCLRKLEMLLRDFSFEPVWDVLRRRVG